MDPLSVTVSIVAILQLTVKVGQSLKDAGDASTGRSQFITETSNLSNLLVALLSRLDENSPDPWHANVRQMGEKNGLIYQYRVALEQLKDKISTERGVKKTMKTLLWKYIKDDAERILLRIERLKSLVQIALQMDHFKLSQAMESRIISLQDDNKIIKVRIDTIQQDQDRQKQDQDLQRHCLIMDWLSPDEFSAQQSDFMARRQADTGRWFLNSHEFTEWVHGTSPTLFCSGMPGAGKTMIAAIAVHHLQNYVQTSNIGVAYLYCNYKMQANQTTPDLLAAIIKQLVQDRPSIAQPLSNLYDRHRLRRTRPPLDEILNVLQSVLTSHSKVYVVLDALDECSERDGTRSQLLRICRNLQKITDLHLMTTSRDIPDIVQEFKDTPRVEVRASNADLKRYVMGNVDRFSKFVRRNSDLQELVQNKVAEAADGMFLLARLHVDSLVNKKTTTQLISALNNLSHGSEALKYAYDEAIARIDGQLQDDRVLAKNVLSWVSYAQRPLTTGELCHALAVEIGDEDFDSDNITDVEDILSVCAGLVTVDEESQVIRLVHYTTQDYLESIREKWNPDAQYNIASTCLTYLCFQPFSSGSCPSDAEFESRLERYGFLDYSARYWQNHVATVQQETGELAMHLLQHSSLVACVHQASSVGPYKYKMYSQPIQNQVTGLHLAVSFGHLQLSKNLLSWIAKDKAILVDSKDSLGQTPLMWAAENGHEETVELLLEIGKAEINEKDFRGSTPLILAAGKGHKEVVELLLRADRVDVDAKDSLGQTPLMWAAENGHKKTVELLLCIGADINAKDHNGSTVLMREVKTWRKEIVELLLGADKVDVNAKDNNGWTPLISAAKVGQKEIAQLLLDTDKVDVNAENNGERTALMWAAWNGHNEIVQLLLGTGKVDVNRKHKGKTLLLWAAQYGHKEIVESLLSTGKTDIDETADGWTPLMRAAQHGHKEIVELLLGTGKADINKTADRWTPLALAAANGHKETVELLLATGKAEIDANVDGWTPLMCAARNGHKEIVELLLATGEADIKRMAGGCTLLALAAANGHKDIVELLLETGEVDVNAKDIDGSTALMLAEEYGYGDIVDLLEAHISLL